MEVWLLKVKHIYDDEFEDCGIFTSKKNMDAGKKEYLKTRAKDGFKNDEFQFTHSTFILNKIN